MRRVVIPVGTEFEELTVIDVGEIRVKPSGQKYTTSICECTCGNIVTVINSNLSRGMSTHCSSCQRLNAGKKNKTHGLSRTPEYQAWQSMINRCLNCNREGFKDWGGRGISVYPTWVLSFEVFFAYVGKKPTPQHSLDRFPDNNGNYEPGNVRWATAVEQANNKRPCKPKIAFVA